MIQTTLFYTHITHSHSAWHSVCLSCVRVGLLAMCFSVCVCVCQCCRIRAKCVFTVSVVSILWKLDVMCRQGVASFGHVCVGVFLRDVDAWLHKSGCDSWLYIIMSRSSQLLTHGHTHTHRRTDTPTRWCFYPQKYDPADGCVCMCVRENEILSV